MLNIILIAMVIFAIITIQTNVLRRAIIYACVFSLLSSFCYLLYKAPDVAIAEAVIGCTLSTILYLVALKKYKIFRVYYCYKGSTSDKKSMILSLLKDFSLDIELEVDLIYTRNSVDDIINNSAYDIIIEHTNKQITIHGDESNYHFDSIVNFFNSNCSLDIIYNYIPPVIVDE